MVSACITQNEGSQIKPQIITIQQEIETSSRTYMLADLWFLPVLCKTRDLKKAPNYHYSTRNRKVVGVKCCIQRKYIVFHYNDYNDH